MLYSDFDFSSFPKAPRSIRVIYSFNFSNVFFSFLKKKLVSDDDLWGLLFL